MKIGHTQYSDEATAHIKDVKEQIESLQSEVNSRYAALLEFLKTTEKEVDEDYLFDYVYNDFNPYEED